MIHGIFFDIPGYDLRDRYMRAAELYESKLAEMKAYDGTVESFNANRINQLRNETRIPWSRTQGGQELYKTLPEKIRLLRAKASYVNTTETYRVDACELQDILNLIPEAHT